MKHMLLLIVLALLTSLSAGALCADSCISVSDTMIVSKIDNDITVDTIAEIPSDSISLTKSTKQNFIQKIINYFTDANKEHPDKAFDISFIGGPHYSSESGFGIGLAGSGRYRAGRCWRTDTITPWSNITLKVDVTTGQLYKVGVSGYHIFPGDKYRINYDTYFYSFADKFWGIGYDNNKEDDNETKYKRLQSEIKVDFVFKLRQGVFLGPMASFSYINARDFDNISLLDDQATRTFTTGLGLTFMVDTRDIPTGATKGVYVRLDQLFNPGCFANKYSFSSTEAMASTYVRVWKGGIIAPMAHARFTYGNTPWGLMSTFGGSHYMRGYYEGRYRDKCAMDFTVELRQHVWRRNGVVLWVGAGTVFPKFSALRLDKVLPNFGIGYRWEFKKGVNVRLDVGFGKNDKGINFSLNEAF